MPKGANAKPKASKARVAAPAKKSATGARAGNAKRAKKSATARSAAATPVAAKPAAVPARLTLGTECTLRDSANLKSQLLNTVSATDSVVVEGGAVEKIDTAALQLLVAFALREAAAGRRLEWVSASEELLGAGARLGLLEVLSLSAYPRLAGSP
jgi:phospholipid transport system transporter-binding protein